MSDWIGKYIRGNFHGEEEEGEKEKFVRLQAKIGRVPTVHTYTLFFYGLDRKLRNNLTCLPLATIQV